MYKLDNNLSPPIMNRVFKLNSDSRYNLMQISQFSKSLVKSVYHGRESISYIDSKIQDILPADYKTLQNLDTFKIKIKKWKPENCPCRLCKVKVMIEQVFFKKVKKPELFFTEQVILHNVLKMLSSQSKHKTYSQLNESIYKNKSYLAYFLYFNF